MTDIFIGSGKSYNLQSLTVGTTEDETVSRMTICVTSDDITFEQIKKQLNQMMGSAATSLSSMLSRKIDISPPTATVIDLTEDIDESMIDSFLSGQFVKISFRMEIGNLVDSEIMQLYPISFAREMCAGVTKTMEIDNQSVVSDSAPTAANPQQFSPPPSSPMPTFLPALPKPSSAWCPVPSVAPITPSPALFSPGYM